MTGKLIIIAYSKLPLGGPVGDDLTRSLDLGAGSGQGWTTVEISPLDLIALHFEGLLRALEPRFFSLEAYTDGGKDGGQSEPHLYSPPATFYSHHSFLMVLRHLRPAARG